LHDRCDRRRRFGGIIPGRFDSDCPFHVRLAIVSAPIALAREASPPVVEHQVSS
jgi:hypothetical protein